MKKIIILLEMAMFVMVSHVALSQTTKTYGFDSIEKVTEKKTYKNEVTLCFDSLVPNDSLVSQLLIDGKIQVSQNQLKGHYEQFILFYVPQVEVDSCFLKDGIVSYKGFEAKNQPRIFSWWYLLAVLCIVCMIIAQRSFKKRTKSTVPIPFVVAIIVEFFLSVLFFITLRILVLSTVIVSMTMAMVMVISILSMFIGLIACMIASSVATNKKTVYIFFYVYYLGMFVLCVSIYLM
ncbi:MAG: hypothetical protein WCH65_07910 [bacterium]